MLARYLTSIGGRVIGALAQTAVLALLARSLGVQYFGRFAVVLAIAQLVYVVFDLGFGTRLLQLRVDPRARGLFGSVLIVRGTAVLVTALSAGIAAFLLDGLSLWLVLAVALYASGEMVGDSAVLVFQGELKVKRAMAVLLSRRLIALVPFAFGLSVQNALISVAVTGALGHAIFWPVIARRAGRPLPMREVLQLNGAIVLLTGGTSLTQSDTVVVSAVSSASLVSAYAAASRLSNPVNLAISTMVQVLIPELTALARSRARTEFARARRVVLLLAGLVAVCSLFSPLIVQVLYGEQFAASAPILTGVIIGAAISAVSQVHMAYLLAHGPQLLDGLIVGSAVLLGLLALGVAAALGGAAGSGIGYVAMEAVILLGVLAGYRRSAARVEAAPDPAEAG